MVNSVEYLVEVVGLGRYPAEQLSPILEDGEEVLPVSFATKSRYQKFCHDAGYEFITITLINDTINVYFLDDANNLSRFTIDVNSPDLDVIERRLLQELASTKFQALVSRSFPYAKFRQPRPN